MNNYYYDNKYPIVNPIYNYNSIEDFRYINYEPIIDFHNIKYYFLFSFLSLLFFFPTGICSLYYIYKSEHFYNNNRIKDGNTYFKKSFMFAKIGIILGIAFYLFISYMMN